jgi:8-oxo-dGTP pyrophosphatase MutT (NUDIX family)
MADISFHLDGYRINLRVGGILISDTRVLLNRMEKDDYWFLPGGRIATGESSAQAMLREIREELGIACRILRPVFLLENFFALAGESFHELGLYYLLDADDAVLPEDGARSDTDAGIRFHWQPVERLNEIDFRPTPLGARLQNLPVTLEHIVVRD